MYRPAEAIPRGVSAPRCGLCLAWVDDVLGDVLRCPQLSVGQPGPSGRSQQASSRSRSSVAEASSRLVKARPHSSKSGLLATMIEACS